MSSDRSVIADDLYLQRGAADAAHRCDANTRLGTFDLGALILAGLEVGPGDTVVDLGCGDGGHLARMAAAVGASGQAIGFDLSPHAVELARARGLRAHVADAAAIPRPDASVDALACIFAIYYHPDVDAVVEEVRRVLKPGGRVVVAGPAADTNRELYDFHRRATGAEPSDADRIALGYVRDRVLPALEAAGFVDVRCSNHRNVIRFPTGRAFLDYWKATSLFARTPGARVEDGEAEADLEAEFVLTKQVDVVVGRR